MKGTDSHDHLSTIVFDFSCLHSWFRLEKHVKRLHARETPKWVNRAETECVIVLRAT